MDPIITKMLEGVPYSGMGSTLERNALIGVVRNLISEDKHTVDYILSYCESVGYQRQMAEDVFKELTGLSPALIVNNNAYYDMPSYVPNMCIAWGIAKGNKEKAFYIVPFEYGYAVMEKDEVNAPIPTVISATIPEAFIELKKVAKNIQTLDKIITKKLLETEDVQSTADNVHQVNLPYSLSPLQVLKKNFKDKVLSISEFEKQASKLVQSGELTVDEAEDLMTWKQDLIDEDESYANDTLQLDETWKPLNAEDDDNSFEEALLFVEETINNDNNNENESYPLAFEEAERLFGVDAEKLQEEYDRRHDSLKSEKIMPSEIYEVAKSKLPSEDIDHHDSDLYIKVTPESKKLIEKLEYKNSGMLTTFKDDEGTVWYELPFCYPMGKQSSKNDWQFYSKLNFPIKPWYKNTYKTDDYGEELDEQVTFSDILENPQNSYELLGVSDSLVRERVFAEICKITGLPYEQIFNKWLGKKSASKKVTAENMTLDDIEAEDNKDQVTEEIDKINEKPVEEIFSETTPEEYFEDALSEDKVDTINEVVSRCIDKFSEKFKDFDQYNVQILSYNTKVLGDYEPVEDELVEDKELNANAILQVILAIKNKADESDMKKALAVFSVTNGELHWTGTIRGENDQIVAFTEEGLDSLFEVEDIKEEELEDII